MCKAEWLVFYDFRLNILIGREFSASFVIDDETETSILYSQQVIQFHPKPKTRNYIFI